MYRRKNSNMKDYVITKTDCILLHDIKIYKWSFKFVRVKRKSMWRQRTEAGNVSRVQQWLSRYLMRVLYSFTSLHIVPLPLMSLTCTTHSFTIQNTINLPLEYHTSLLTAVFNKEAVPWNRHLMMRPLMVSTMCLTLELQMDAGRQLKIRL